MIIYTFTYENTESKFEIYIKKRCTRKIPFNIARYYMGKLSDCPNPDILLKSIKKSTKNNQKNFENKMLINFLVIPKS